MTGDTVWAVLRVVEIDGVSTTTLVGVFSSGAKAERYVRESPDRGCFVLDDHIIDDLDTPPRSTDT